MRDQVGDLSGTLANNLGGIATIKAFTAEAARGRSASAPSRRPTAEANADAIRLSSAFVPLIRIAILIGFTITLLIGGNMVINGTLNVGFFSVLVFMTQRLLWPLTRLGETFDLYQRAMASHAAHLRPARRAAHHHRGPLRCSRSRSPAPSGSTTCASPTTPAPRCSTASTSTSPPERPTPSSASPAPARARS